MKPSTKRAIFFAVFFLARAGVYSEWQETRTEAKDSNKQPSDQWNVLLSPTRTYVAELNKNIDLKPAQQDAWKSFVAGLTMSKNEETQLGEEARMAAPENSEAMTTPEKLSKISDTMRRNAENVRRMAYIVKDFYDVLSVEQKAIFDLYSIKDLNI